VLYLNVASAGLSRFADEISLEVEKYTADHLKKVLRRDQDAGLVRADCDINLTAFIINSLYIMFMASLVSRHFQIRLQEYLGLKKITVKAMDQHLIEVVQFIHNLLRP
jgi:hypothetical protein